jgi:putative sigma-54 modulation protein
MKVQLSGHHVEITPALRMYATKKLARIVQRFDQAIDVHCILTVEKLRHKAESTVTMPGKTIYADAIDDDMYAAIDLLTDKLDRRVRKRKERVVDHHAPEAQKHGHAPAL